MSLSEYATRDTAQILDRMPSKLKNKIELITIAVLRNREWYLCTREGIAPFSFVDAGKIAKTLKLNQGDRIKIILEKVVNDD